MEELDLVNVEPSRFVIVSPKGRPRKTWSKVIRSDPKERSEQGTS